MPRRVALGMSGGVDSSVAVDVLQRCGFDVVGVTCRFQDGPAADEAVCASRAVCERMGAKHAVHECADAFERHVVAPFVRAYACGLTPSPCVGCNAAVKIPELAKAAQDLGCDYVATGHYARVARLEDNGRFVILAGLDHRKDQSYMLGMLTQGELSRLVLPLGGMTKAEVRMAAFDLGLCVADAPESQDICFAPSGYRALLAERGVSLPAGNIVNVAGEVIGHHSGLADYTIGQRKGIGVAGPKPYYVIEKRADSNELVVGTAEESRVSSVAVGQLSWQAFERLDAPLEAMVKLRYRSAACPCIIEPRGDDRARVALLEPQSATAPGQYAVFYQGATVLGGGVIEEVG